MSAPRKIWTVSHADEYGQYFPEAVEAEGEYGGTAVAYHHDDVVRELVEALKRAEQAINFSLPLSDGPKSETAALMLFRAQAEARIALAKIAQEG